MPAQEWEAFCRGWARNLIANVDGALYNSHYVDVAVMRWEASAARWR